MSDWYSPGEIEAVEWHSYGEFIFKPEIVIWAIPYLEEMEKGLWPPMPANHIWELVEKSTKGDSEAQNRLEIVNQDMQKYAELMKRGGHIPAPFERSVEIGADLSERIENCNEDGSRDGSMLIDEYKYFKSDDEMHKTYNMDIDEISFRISRALSYVCGKRKGNYRYWCWRNKKNAE
jgi:hypothetical protein